MKKEGTTQKATKTVSTVTRQRKSSSGKPPR